MFSQWWINSQLLHLVYIYIISIFIETTRYLFTMMDKFSTFSFGVHRQYIYLHRDNQKAFHNVGWILNFYIWFHCCFTTTLSLVSKLSSKTIQLWILVMSLRWNMLQTWSPKLWFLLSQFLHVQLTDILCCLLLEIQALHPWWSFLKN